MNELTTIQAVIYGISGFLLYCLGVTAGKAWSDYCHQNQPRQRRKTKQQLVEFGFDPNNPINSNFSFYQWATKRDVITDQYGKWYIRRPL